MARSFTELRNEMSPDRQAKAALRAQAMMADLLMELIRGDLGLGEASTCTVAQLRQLVEGLGGELEITIRLRQASIRIS